jgi:hypothetical protein
MRQIYSIILVLFFLALPSHSREPSHKLYSISCKTIKFEAHERIVGFKLNIKGGSVACMPKIPNYWSINIVNSANETPPWSTNVSATVGVAAASLSADFLQNFVIIRKESDYSSIAPPLDAQLEVFASRDFVKSRKFVIPLKDMILSENQKSTD